MLTEDKKAPKAPELDEEALQGVAGGDLSHIIKDVGEGSDTVGPNQSEK